MADIEGDSAKPDPGADYERSDAHLGGIAWSGIALAAVSAAVLFGVVGLFDFLAARNGGVASGTETPSAALRQLPPAPRLEGLPQPTDQAEANQAGQDQAPAGYEWADRPNGIVRIPIEAAMRIAVGQLKSRLPIREPDSQRAAEQSTPPGSSSSGRIVVEKENQP